MKLLLEALVAGSIILGSCASTQKQQTEIRALEEIVDDYQRGKELKIKAEENPAQRQEYYERAANAFYTAMLKRNNTYDAMIEYADCLSQSGDLKQALEWIDKALTLQKTDTAYDTKGLICAKNGFLSFAEECFTNAIAMRDTPQYRWHRFQTRLKTAQTEDNYLDKALEDIKKVTEQRPNEPEGYIFTASVYGIMMFTRRDKTCAKEVYTSLRKAFELIDAGNKTKFSIFELDELRTVYKELKKHFEPIKTTFE
jgi:tetratricopeptide (TPR) repeat protein